MSWLKENKIYALLDCINVVFILTLIQICYKIENFDFLFVTALLVGGFLFYWFYHSVLKTFWVRTSFWGVIVLGAAVFYFRNIEKVNKYVYDEIINKVIYINSTIAQALPTSFVDYKLILIIALPVIVFIILALTTRGFSNSILLFNLCGMVTLWYFGYTEEISKYLFYYVLLSLTTYCINSYLKNVKKLTKSGIRIGITNTRMLIYTLGTSFIVASLTNYLPQNYKGVYGTDIRSRIYNKFAKPVEDGEKTARKLQYDLSYSGYSSSGSKLGGAVTLDQFIAFRVQSDKQYYLKGISKDFYDGFAWVQSEKSYQLKTPEKNMVRSSFSEGFTGEITNLIIQPEGLKTSTMFTTNVFLSTDYPEGVIYYDDELNIINSILIREPYTVNFNKLNPIGENIKNTRQERYFREAGITYYNDNFSKYLQVPDNVSPRIYDLVYNLVKGKKTTADKINAIKKYLNDNYPYSLEVSQVPEGQEFLDYFLFTEKKGYCTYFATAVTIMCRIAGIPARYAEGFNMTSEKDTYGLYVVRNENAHAWSEVLYVNENGNGLWYEVDAVPNAVEIVHKQEEEKRLNEQKANPGSEVNPGSTPIQNPAVDEGAFEESIEENVLTSRMKAAAVCILIFLFLNFLLIIYHYINKKRMIKNKSIIPIYKYSLNRLLDVTIKENKFIGEMEFAEKLPMKIREHFREAAALADAEYFGGKPPAEFDKLRYYKFLEAYIKERQSGFEYFTKKYYFISKISFIRRKIMLIYKGIKE
jgi:hypothetical protein